MSPRRDRVVKVRVSEQELSAWHEQARESFEGNLSDAIRSAMSPSAVSDAMVATAHRALEASVARFQRTIPVGPVNAFVPELEPTRVTPMLNGDPDAFCPHGRVRGSQWCPRCDV